MSVLRAFIAVELPASLREEIIQETAELRREVDSTKVRWLPSQNLHLTLKFLGSISPTSIEELAGMIKREADSFPPFAMTINGMGCFPNARKPRVIWVGLVAPAVLETLQRAIESGAERLGYEPEERPFSPHLTIGRVRQNLPGADVQTLRAALDKGSFTNWEGTQLRDRLLQIDDELKALGVKPEALQ